MLSSHAAHLLVVVVTVALCRAAAAQTAEKPCCIALAKLNPPTKVADFTLYCQSELPAEDGPSPVDVVVPIPGSVRYKRIQRNYTDQSGSPNVYSVCFATISAPAEGAGYVLPPWPAAIKFPTTLPGASASLAGKMCFGSSAFYQITLPNGAAYAVCADGFATNIPGMAEGASVGAASDGFTEYNA